MLNIDIPTEGKKIITDYSRLSLHDTLHIEMANMSLLVGSMKVSLDFDTWDEMIAFCEEHNFPYNDKRQHEWDEQTKSYILKK